MFERHLSDSVPTTRRSSSKRSKFSRRSALHELAVLHGIEVEYQDGLGKKRVVPDKTLRFILENMKIRVKSSDEIRWALGAAKTRSWTQLIDDVIVVKPTTAATTHCVLSIPIGMHRREELTIRWEIVSEAGNRRCGVSRGTSIKLFHRRTFEGQRYVKTKLALPARLTYGYYSLSVTVSFYKRIIKGRSLLIVTPPSCYQIPQTRKFWGLTVQLYGLRSMKNWGVGDLHDLRRLTRWAGCSLGADMVGINPLHALPPGLLSPYSPSSRLFHNPMYLDVEGILEFRTTPSIRRAYRRRAFQDRLHASRQGELVDYQEVHAMKWPVFEKLYRAFYKKHLQQWTRRGQAFDRFCRKQGGQVLFQYALFQVLSEHFGGKGWGEWPVEYQNPNSVVVTKFGIDHRDRIDFFRYLEWQCELQLQNLDRVTTGSGMTIGLYHDLAVGIHPDGADAWVFQNQLASQVTVGAPPDHFNLLGQNWGVQPPDPQQLRATGYQFIRETLRRNMQYGGLLRLDHALGLFRLFWIPKGEPATQGAYVRYKHEELLAILAIESERSRVMIVGEDLGTVTPMIRRRLSDAGLLSYRLLMFEKPTGRGFQRPRAFPTQALVSANTHDLPTLRGFWVGRDIEIKEKLKLYPSKKKARQDWFSRERDRMALLSALKREGLLPQGCSLHQEDVLHLTDELCRSIYAYLARTSSQIVSISLEDMLGEIDTPNVPGAPHGSYPVWQRKLVRPFDQWRKDPLVYELARMFHRERSLRGTRVSTGSQNNSLPRTVIPASL